MSNTIDLSEQTTTISRRSYGAAYVAIGISAYILWHRFPSIYQDGAMWAEGGVLYFLKSIQGTFLENIQALDYGYVPLWCRLWAFLVSRLGISAASAAQAYNCIALIVAAFSCGAFALPQFRTLVASDLCRIMVCLGLACAPDYETKTFINASYYPAIICYLVLTLAAKNQYFDKKLGSFAGAFMAVSMLSKPHYLAFGPFLMMLLMVALWKRRSSLFILTALPLTAACIQFLVLFSHRAGVSPRTLSPVEFISTWTRWLGACVKAELIGQAFMHWSAYDISAACLLAAGCVAGIIKKHFKLTDLMWPAALGCSLFFSGLALGILSFPDMYVSRDPHHVHSLMQIRHFFIPMVGCYFTLALLLANTIPLRGRALLVALWLSLAWPFGWVKAPPAPTWPTVGFSAWEPLAQSIFAGKDVERPRGCIPVNPYPWMLGLDCQMLQGIDGVSELLHQPAVALKERYRAPDAATGWLVDTIGLRVINLDVQTQQVAAYDAQGVEMARTKALASPGSALTYFHFTPPLIGPAEIAIIDSAPQPSSVVMDLGQSHPAWVWLGRKLQ